MVVEPSRHADSIDALDDVTGSPRRVGQQYDALARLDQAAKTLKGSRQRGDAVMDDPPEIENKSVVARRDLPDTAD
jgi:hypothetical protein